MNNSLFDEIMKVADGIESGEGNVYVFKYRSGPHNQNKTHKEFLLDDDEAKQFADGLYKGGASNITWESEGVRVPYTDVKDMPANTQEQRKVVMDYMHHTGKHHSEVKGKQYLEIAKLADGFGEIDESSDGFEDMIYDWSHIRDSSPRGIKRMYDYLVKNIIK